MFLLILREHICSPLFLLWSVLLIILAFCIAFFCLCYVSHIHVLYMLFVFYAHSGIQHMLCCRFCFVCLPLVCPLLPVSLDCPFLIATSAFYYVYLQVPLDYLFLNVPSVFYTVYRTNEFNRSGIKKPFVGYSIYHIWSLRRVWRYQRGNQNPYIEEEQDNTMAKR